MTALKLCLSDPFSSAFITCFWLQGHSHLGHLFNSVLTSGFWMLCFYSIVTFRFVITCCQMCHMGLEHAFCQAQSWIHSLAIFLPLPGTWQTSTSMKGALIQHQHLPRNTGAKEGGVGRSMHVFRDWKNFQKWLFRGLRTIFLLPPLVTNSLMPELRGKPWTPHVWDAWIKITVDFWQESEHCDLSGSPCRVVAHWITK